MLVDPDDGAVDDRVLEVWISRQALEKTLVHAFLGPSLEALGDHIPLPEAIVQITPRRARARDPEHGFEEQAVVLPRTSRIPGLAG